MESSEYQLQLIDNKLQFKPPEPGQVDGVKLTDDEREYLLPHFLMLLIGKPGSGKTTLLKQLVTNNQMYYRKFDDVLLVSPSHAKMGIKIKKENTTSKFSLDWIFEKIDEFNDQQLNEVFGHKLKMTAKEKKQADGTMAIPKMINDDKSRFLLSDMYKTTPGAVSAAASRKKRPVKQAPTRDEDKEMFMQKKYDELKKLPREQQEQTHKNVLIILDDVVGSIKKAEFDPRLAQLVMNRRHLVFNGTISIIMVTQKYTLIPSRVRSNASWVVAYQLNPADFEAMYRDVVVFGQQKWRDILTFVFGAEMHQDFNMKSSKKKLSSQEYDEEIEVTDQEEEEKKPQSGIKEEIGKKKFENIGIWVELNIYFKNFKRIKI